MSFLVDELPSNFFEEGKIYLNYNLSSDIRLHEKWILFQCLKLSPFLSVKYIDFSVFSYMDIGGITTREYAYIKEANIAERLYFRERILGNTFLPPSAFSWQEYTIGSIKIGQCARGLFKKDYDWMASIAPILIEKGAEVTKTYYKMYDVMDKETCTIEDFLSNLH